MNQHDKKVFKVAFEEGYTKGTRDTAAKSYSRGYAKGLRKSTVIRVREHTFITVPSNDEKEWESKINYFAWAAIISLILFGITAELYAHNYNSTQVCKKQVTLLNTALDTADNYCIQRIQQCWNKMEELKHSPVITELNATIVTGLDGGRYCPREQVTPFADMSSWYCDMGDVREIQ